MWNLNDISVGDTIEVEVVNKRGDRNLDGARIRGKIKDVIHAHNMVRLESGWCCHTKDRLIRHESSND